jgi:hypothetical protein
VLERSLLAASVDMRQGSCVSLAVKGTNRALHGGCHRAAPKDNANVSASRQMRFRWLSSYRAWLIFRRREYVSDAQDGDFLDSSEHMGYGAHPGVKTGHIYGRGIIPRTRFAASLEGRCLESC